MGKKVVERTWFTSRQKKFLAVVSQEKDFCRKFYLTGGTALSAVYYNHRESLDLDFFSSEEFTTQELGHLLTKTRRALGWVGIKRDINYPVNIYILTWEDGSFLRLDFNYFCFKRLKKGPKFFGIEVDSLEDIAANKLDAILSRKEARDYVDLYTILTREKLTILDVYKLHQRKIQFELDILGLARVLLAVREAVNFPKMKIPFKKTDMIEFFENQARELKKEIFV